MIAKITLDSSSYEKGVDGAKKSSADLQAEMASMQNLATALQNRVKTLGARFNEAKTKLDDLAKKLNESSEASGENSEETQKLVAQFAKAQEEVKKLGTQLVNVSRESANADERLEELKKAAESASDGVDDVTESSEELGDTLEESGSKVSMFGEMLKANLTSDAIKDGVKKLASAVVDVGKASFEGYSQYEQLVGGVETLFKNSANVVQNYAKNAYKTAGLSANDYMSTVTSFSASLLQSLGQDTAAAAEYADMAITDMSDNANKMGTSMESIQNAYQGFAKQNYTMLDNLKLGYGGTKAEMERLLEDAQELKRANGEMVTYSIDSFADMVEAIHVVQENMDITGTTAKEAEDTIEGSVNSMKAAWENLATGMADETADMTQLTQNFVDSVGIAAKNIIPKIQKIVTGVGTATVETISYLRETNETVDLVVSVVEDLGIVAASAGAVLAANFAGQKIMSVVSSFQSAQVQLALFTLNTEGATLAQAALSGQLTVGEIAVGVLTGKISLATAAQYAWNTAINANPIGVLVGLVGALAVVVTKARKSTNTLADSFTIEAKTASECAAHLQTLKDRYSELTNGENNPNKWAQKDRSEIEALKLAIEDTTTQLYSLTDAETSAAIASGELTGAELEAEERATALAEATEEYAKAMQDLWDSTLNSAISDVEGYFEPFEKASVKVSTSIKKMMDAMQSQTDFNTTYADNLQYLSDVGLGGFVDKFREYGAEGAGYAAQMAKEIQKAGGDTTEAGQELIQKLLDQQAALTESESALGETMALHNQDMLDEMKEATDSYAEAVAELDMSAEALEAGINTITALASGIESSTPTVLSKVDSLASQMKSRLQSSFSGFTLNISAIVSTKNSHKNGLDYVPFDGYIAELHKGERVLTAEEASAYRAGKTAADSGSGIVINQYIQTPVETPAELAAATEAYFQQARWALAL